MNATKPVHYQEQQHKCFKSSLDVPPPSLQQTANLTSIPSGLRQGSVGRPRQRSRVYPSPPYLKQTLYPAERHPKLWGAGTDGHPEAPTGALWLCSQGPAPRPSPLPAPGGGAAGARPGRAGRCTRGTRGRSSARSRRSAARPPRATLLQPPPRPPVPPPLAPARVPLRRREMTSSAGRMHGRGAGRGR